MQVVALIVLHFTCIIIVSLTSKLCMYTPQHSRLLMNGAKLVATHKSRYFERGDGLAIGPGAFVTALEYASGKEAIVVGKPSPTFYQSVMKDFNCPSSEVVMIGDVRELTIGCYRGLEHMSRQRLICSRSRSIVLVTTSKEVLWN